MQSEFGSSSRVRFLDTESVRMYDSNGNVMLCKCGKPACGGIYAKEAYKQWCKDCDPNKAAFSAQFIYRPPNAGECKVQDATMGVKFAQNKILLDDWHIILGTPWTRMLFRLRHPIVYSKRGLRNLYRRVRRLFIKDEPFILTRTWKTKEEMTNLLPDVPDLCSSCKNSIDNTPSEPGSCFEICENCSPSSFLKYMSQKENKK